MCMALGSILNTAKNKYKWKKPFYYHAYESKQAGIQFFGCEIRGYYKGEDQ